MLAHPAEALTVGTVVTGYGLDWYRAQRRFLDAGGGYRHLVYAVDADADFPSSELVGRCRSGPTTMGNPSHVLGLNAIADRMRELRADRCLLLDSDCFPVRPDWLAVLEGMLSRAGRDAAAVVRTEDLCLHPHPSAVYARDPEMLRFRVGEYRDMVGEVAHDTVFLGDFPWLPLVRTNGRNPHPILAGVYGDLFYHHGSGSRHYTNHVDDYGYYDHLELPQHSRISERFWADPEGFVAWLRGRDG